MAPSRTALNRVRVKSQRLPFAAEVSQDAAESERERHRSRLLSVKYSRRGFPLEVWRQEAFVEGGIQLVVVAGCEACRGLEGTLLRGLWVVCRSQGGSSRRCHCVLLIQARPPKGHMRGMER